MNPWMTEADEAALAQFEAIVLSQKPAATPWKPVTDYSFEARAAIEGDHPQLIKDVFRPACVLDVGCGPQAILVRLLRQIGVIAAGCDPQITEPHARYLFRGDVTDDSIHARHTDLVICREVLEHLTVPQVRRAVTTLCRLSARFVYVTTRFTPNPTSFLAVGQSDDLDPTHISMTNQAWLRHLFVLEGFKRRADLEQALDWKNFGRVLVYERA